MQARIPLIDLLVLAVAGLVATLACVSAFAAAPIQPQELLGLVSGVPSPAPYPHVAIAYITGPLSWGGDILLQPRVSVEEYVKLIETLADAPTVKAVVLVVDSPGGEASASYELYKAVERLAERKPVVVYTPGTLASGAYMAALPAKVIVASPVAVVGSIGASLTVVKLGGLLSKIGVRVYTYHEGKLKTVGTPYTEKTTPEEEKVFMDLVDSIYKLFKSLVQKHRGNLPPEVFESAPYPAEKAVKLGLVDKIGSLEDALQEARKLAGNPALPAETYKVRRTLLQALLGLSTPASTPPLLQPSVRILLMWPPP